MMWSPPLLAALGWGQHWLHRETLCGNSAAVLRRGLGCPCSQLFLGSNKIKSLVRGCWLGAPLSVQVSLHGLEETHEQGTWCPGSMCAWGCLQ